MQEPVITCRVFSVGSLGMHTDGKSRLPFGELTYNTSETIPRFQWTCSEMLNQTREKLLCIREGTRFFGLFKKGFPQRADVWS